MTDGMMTRIAPTHHGIGRADASPDQPMGHGPTKPT